VKEEGMQPDVLVAYGSKHGSTREIAQAIAEAFGDSGVDAHAESALTADPHGTSAVVVGAALYTGKLHAHAVRFLERYEDVLAELPLAIFASGPRTLEPEDVTSSLRQLRSGLNAAVPSLEPVSLMIFGGAIDPSRLRWPLSRMQASDARDWDAVRDWAEELAHRPDFVPVSAVG
jgi:menaquinone-dependent protoporphyrinogen oxidase